MSNIRYWLWFVVAFRPGNERIWEMLSPFRDVKKAYEAVCGGAHPSLSNIERKKAVSTHIEQCDSIIEYCKDNGYRIIAFDDENYPPLLRNIYNPPAVLFCMGNIENFNSRPSIACVGTRKPSVYSVDVTEKICSELSKREFAVVSGFALGLDSAAHKGVLKNNGCTVAVLACGIDVSYPKENAVAKKNIAVNGAVVSEFLPGTRPDRYCFHVRNRIISGMCFGTLITEAAEGSGSLITASHAADQGRVVFCIPPGDIFDKRYSGVIKYLRDGAVPVFSHLDVLYEYYRNCGFRHTSFSVKWPELYGEDDIPYRDSRSPGRKKKVKSLESVQEIPKTLACWERLLDEMDDKQQIIAKSLRSEPKNADDISSVTDMELFDIMSSLTELEMMGAVLLTPDHKYMLI